jgi:hypothetical protein
MVFSAMKFKKGHIAHPPPPQILELTWRHIPKGSSFIVTHIGI